MAHSEQSNLSLLRSNLESLLTSDYDYSELVDLYLQNLINQDATITSLEISAPVTIGFDNYLDCDFSELLHLIASLVSEIKLASEQKSIHNDLSLILRQLNSSAIPKMLLSVKIEAVKKFIA
jgi:hypothetical protein